MRSINQKILLAMLAIGTSFGANAAGPYHGKVNAITSAASAAYVTFSSHHSCGHGSEYQILKTQPNFDELYASLLMAKSEKSDVKLTVYNGCHNGGYRKVHAVTVY